MCVPLRPKIFKKLWHRRYQLSHRNGVDADVHKLRPTFGLSGASFTTPTKSTIGRSTAAICTQFTHKPTRSPRWADNRLSPMSTAPNTVAHISPKVLLKRSHLGTHRFTAPAAALRRSMSPRSISFQVEPESSTVVHRQPLRSLIRIGETRAETPGNRWLDLIVVSIEGTLWTWRRQPLVSPI